MLRLALGKLVLRDGGVAHVVHARQTHTEAAAVVHHAGQGHAAHVHAVISPLARDKHLTLRLALDAVVAQRHLHGRVHRLGARVGEEDAVEALGRVVRHALGQLKSLGVCTQEGRSEVQRLQLLVDRLSDLLAAVAGGHAEQAC